VENGSPLVRECLESCVYFLTSTGVKEHQVLLRCQDWVITLASQGAQGEGATSGSPSPSRVKSSADDGSFVYSVVFIHRVDY
jgi:hypothetical protein